MLREGWGLVRKWLLTAAEEVGCLLCVATWPWRLEATSALLNQRWNKINWRYAQIKNRCTCKRWKGFKKQVKQKIPPSIAKQKVSHKERNQSNLKTRPPTLTCSVGIVMSWIRNWPTIGQRAILVVGIDVSRSNILVLLFLLISTLLFPSREANPFHVYIRKKRGRRGASSFGMCNAFGYFGVKATRRT